MLTTINDVCTRAHLNEGTQVVQSYIHLIAFLKGNSLHELHKTRIHQTLLIKQNQKGGGKVAHTLNTRH